MPLQTHAQFAAPGSVGAWALRHAVGLQRQRRILSMHLEEWRRSCPLGSAAVAGSSLPLDRRVQAEELGFVAPSPNSLYSTGARDECLEMLAILSHVAVQLSGFAGDVLQFAQTPYSWIRYPATFGTGSSSTCLFTCERRTRTWPPSLQRLDTQR